MSGGCVYLRLDAVRVCSLLSFYNYSVRKTYNDASVFIHSLLFHAEMIRTGGLDHRNASILDFTYIGIAYGNHLIFRQGICAIFFTVYTDVDDGSAFVSCQGKDEP